MTLRWLLAALHLVALGIGMAGVVNRAAALRGPLDAGGIRRVLRADSVWGLAALLWIGTGLVRVFGGFEKGTSYYMTNSLFWYKMGLFVLILVLEVWPAVVFTRWRRAGRRGGPIDTSRALLVSRISRVEAALVLLMVFVATGMARGFGS